MTLVANGAPNHMVGESENGAVVLRNEPECPNCGPDAELVEDFKAGDLICESCGVVVGDRVVDVRSEWRTFSGNGDKDTHDPNRVAADQNPLLEHLGLSTTISGVKKGTNTRSSESWGLNKLNRVAVSNGDRCLLNGFKIISQMADRIALSQLIVQRAQKIFAHENVQKYIRGKATEGMCAACLYLACRWEKTPRTFKEIMNVTSVPQKTVRKNYKKLISMVDMANVQTISTDDFMARFCSNLKLPMVVQALAAKVATNAFNSDCVSGKSPISIAAAAIYLVTMATDEKRAAKDIATVSGVSESTIKLCFKEMFPKRYKLFPRESFCYDKLDLMKA